MNYSRDFLHHRHRLSHQQINAMVGEQQNQLVFEEKIFQLNQLSIFLKLVDAFIEKDIWFMPLKGPMLSYRIYHDATCRISRDFDFLIKKPDVLSTVEIFRNKGYEYDASKLPQTETTKRHNRSILNQLTLFHPQKGITVEIHWRMFNDPIINFNDIDDVVDDNIRQFEFAGKNMNCFTTEFELLYLIIHGGLHKWSRLKWLVDVREILNRMDFDTIKFEQLTERFGAQRMVGLCNAMLRHFFPGTLLLPIDYPVPEWFLQFAIRQAEREKDIPDYRPINLIKLRWYLIQAFPSRMYKRKRFHVLFSSLKKVGVSFSSIVFP